MLVCACSQRSVPTQAAVKFTTDIKALPLVLQEYEERQTIKNNIRCVMIPLTSTGESHPAPH